MGMKPHDKHALPLNAWCHRESPTSQHANQMLFWGNRHINPFDLAAKFYAEYGGKGGKPKKRTTIKPRLPKDQRKKIQSRGFSK